jgi:hypothetical protein
MEGDGDLNVYHAVVATNDPAGIHRRVCLEANSLQKAKELFAAQYGHDNVVSVWEDFESHKRRGYTV